MWPSALTVVGLALAATWYVAPGGTGNGSTTQAPLARIQSAVDSAQPGDEIQVGAGVYREAVSIRGDGGISVTGTGTGEVVIDGQGAATPLAVLAPNVRLSHLVLQGGRGKNLFFSTDRNSDPTVCFPRAGDLELQSVVTRGEVLQIGRAHV